MMAPKLSGIKENKSNILIFTVTEITRHSQSYREQGEAIDWVNILCLNEYPPIVLINVVDDDNNRTVAAYASWGWDTKDQAIIFHKVEVLDASLRRFGIGTTMMKMVIAIAKFYKAPRITGTIAGEEFLWDWYPKLGFTIIGDRKLLMEIK